MAITRRIFVSLPADNWLSESQNDLKWAIVERIEALGYQTEIFFDPRGRDGLASARAWSAQHVEEVARQCVGAAVIGMPRWTFSTPEGDVALPTEFSHYEAALTFTLGLPMLVVSQRDLTRRVVFADTFHGYVGKFPADADRAWLDTREFQTAFDYWKQSLSKRADIFLGYCGSSTATAQTLKAFITGELNGTVLDWQTDFPPGRNILELIEQAARSCSAGVFLFTKDDALAGSGDVELAAPRDNVVFEAGYFIQAKGKGRVLIIREQGAKMPADLGGDVYASLRDAKPGIDSIKDTVRRFLDAL